MKAVLCFLLAAFPTLTAAQQGNQTSPVESFAEQKRRIETLLVKDRERETKARSVLSFAQKALADAQSQNDSTSTGTAQQAVGIAQTALDKASTITARDEERLKALERALRWKTFTEPVGVTSYLKGDVFRETRLGRIRFDPNFPIREGDVLETGPDSGLEVLLSDGTRVEVVANSRFSIAELNSNKSSIQLLKGKVHMAYECVRMRVIGSAQGNVSGEDPCGNRITGVLTPTAVCSVRGTEYEVELLADGSSSFWVIRGTVEVTAKATGKSISLGPGQKAVVMPDGTIKLANTVALKSGGNQ